MKKKKDKIKHQNHNLTLQLAYLSLQDIGIIIMFISIISLKHLMDGRVTLVKQLIYLECGETLVHIVLTLGSDSFGSVCHLSRLTPSRRRLVTRGQRETWSTPVKLSSWRTISDT